MRDSRNPLAHPPDVPRKQPDELPGWFDRPKNARLLKRIAYVTVLILFVSDFFIHYHVNLGWENVPGFWTLFGFLASVILIAMAKIGGKSLKAKEDYYDE
jgi:hypothetical protein